MMTITGVGYNSLAHGRHSLLPWDRQSALGDLAQVPVRLDAGVSGPHPARPSQSSAASASHAAVHPVAACCPVSERLWYRPAASHQLLQVRQTSRTMEQLEDHRSLPFKYNISLKSIAGKSSMEVEPSPTTMNSTNNQEIVCCVQVWCCPLAIQNVYVT